MHKSVGKQNLVMFCISVKQLLFDRKGNKNSLDNVEKKNVSFGVLQTQG